MSVVLTLLVVWTAVLVPPALRARSRARAEFIDSFRRHLDGLERRSAAAQATVVVPTAVSGPKAATAPVPPVPSVPPAHPPASQATAARRRRTILSTLLMAMGTSLLAGFHPEARFLWAVHLFLDDVFLGYVALLVHGRQQAARAPAAIRAPVRVPRPAPVGIGAVVLGARPVPATLGPATAGRTSLARRLAGVGS